MSGYVFGGIAQTKEKNARVRSGSASGWGVEETSLRPNCFSYFERKVGMGKRSREK